MEDIEWNFNPENPKAVKLGSLVTVSYKPKEQILHGVYSRTQKIDDEPATIFFLTIDGEEVGVESRDVEAYFVHPTYPTRRHG